MAVVTLVGETATGTVGVPSFPHGAVSINAAQDNEFVRPVTIYVGGDGDVEVIPYASRNSNVAEVFKGLKAGSTVPCMVYATRAASTTASNLIALY